MSTRINHIIVLVTSNEFNLRQKQPSKNNCKETKKKLSCFFPSDFIEGQEEDSVVMDEDDYENEGIIMQYSQPEQS